jgi:hypothetical protein
MKCASELKNIMIRSLYINSNIYMVKLYFSFLNVLKKVRAVLGGLVGSVLAMGPTRLAAVGSSLAEYGGFLWAISIHSAHFLRRGSKAIGPML